jgi:hypothetical protein
MADHVAQGQRPQCQLRPRLSSICEPPLEPINRRTSASILNAATFNPSNGEVEFGDMNAFRQGGGKLIIYHGWAESDILPKLTIDFYETLAKKSGGMGATQDFARLFMVPGMDHCGIRTDGPGIADTGIDPLIALEQWIEEGEAPSPGDSQNGGEPLGSGCADNSELHVRSTLLADPLCATRKSAEVGQFRTIIETLRAKKMIGKLSAWR